MDLLDIKIAVIGLGYVGLPLAVEFSKYYKTVGFDINADRVCELNMGSDSTLEVDEEELRKCSEALSFSSNVEVISNCNIYIITVPTPIDISNQPDLTPLKAASESVGGVISKGDIVVYESTVYPGTTEEECVPVLEGVSGLVFNKDFYVGYSPERINPGDKERTLINIKKITSGSTDDVSRFVDGLYRKIIKAGTHRAESIRVAEAAKVIENTQRDLNIALMNELALIFNELNIDTEAVLRAAGTKWNFLPFRPGLVGGHCIGVDPYYLTHKAQSVGYHPDVIIAGRRINDGMGKYVAKELVACMVKRGISVSGANILLMGVSFKEDCPDIRNTRVIDIVRELETYNADVDIYDPWVSADEASKELGVKVHSQMEEGNKYDAIVIAVAHHQFKAMGEEKIRALGKGEHILYDLKYVLELGESDLRL